VRIYNDAMAMVREVERDLYEMGVKYQSTTVQDQFVGNDPGFETLELMAYAYTLKRTVGQEMGQMMKYMGANGDWALAELNERISGSPNPGSAWELASEQWKPFLRDGKFAYHYPERLAYQLKYVIQELKDRPNTRQALATMYDVHQDMMNWGGLDRVPCSISYHFILRNKELILVYNQRSCDFLKFFATDVFITCGMLHHVARCLVLPPSSCRFVHVINSLHAFKKDLDARGIY